MIIQLENGIGNTYWEIILLKTTIAFIMGMH